MIVIEVRVPVGEDDDTVEICSRLTAWLIRMSMETNVPLMVQVKEKTSDATAAAFAEEG